jgi:hypothetical protein
MHGVARFALVAGLAACHVGAMDTPDAMGSGDDDGGGGTSGLNVVWTSTPGVIPGMVRDGLTLETVKFRVDNLRVIGDAGPGDTRTAKMSFDVKWDTSHQPETVQFEDAPSGHYSTLSVQIDGHIIDNSYELGGHVTLGTTVWEYEIQDRNVLDVSLAVGKTLDPGGGATVKLQVSFADALNSLDFASLDTDDGKITLGTLDSGITAFRDKLLQGFSIDNTGPN